MKISSIEFIGSFEKLSQCPVTSLPEYAFIGRSNVGKSSLINMILDRKELARISSTPGKTQTINYYFINKEWYLVDLPGYGYAKVSKVSRRKWKRMIENYLKERKNLYCVFSLLDSRHSLQANDLEFINWLGENYLPYVIAYTKSDKVKDDELDSHINSIQSSLLEHWEELPRQFVTSANDRIGKEEILDFIKEINNK